MSDFPRKSFTIPSTNHTYSYIFIKPTSPRKSTIAFFHGFPAIASGWRHQIKYFAEQGYGIIAPDLLGFGGSSKPESMQEYRMRLIVPDLMAVFDHEKIDKYHGVGHDAGSHILSKLYNYHPTRLLSLTFIAIPYNAPGSHFDLEAVNQMTKKLIGFEKFAYIRFLASERSHELIEQHLESFRSLAYHADVDVKADNFYPPGQLEAWLQADRNDEQILLDKEEAALWLDAFGKGGFRAPLNWYRQITDTVNEQDEKADIAAGKMTTEIHVPVLAIDSKPDKSSFPGFLEGSIRPHAKELTIKVVDSQGHYPHILSKEEVNQALEDLISGIDA